MELKSDKKTESTFSFKKIKEFFCESYVVWTIIALAIAYLGYAWVGNFWHIGAAFAIFILLLLISGGEILSEGISFFKIIIAIMAITIPIAWYNTPVLVKSDSMDISNMAKNMIIDKDAKSGTYVYVDFDSPFESKVNIGFPDEKYTKLFMDKEEFKKFKLVAVKTCEKYISDKIECDLYLHVSHQFEETELVKVHLKKSIYPKKFEL